MDNTSSIRIIEKPEDISFDRIHEILWAANEKNRQDGFVLSTSNLTGEQIRDRLGGNGKCFVAMDGDRPVGTMSVRYVKRSGWYAKGIVPDCMMAGVLPEYQGRHVYGMLSDHIFDYIKAQGYALAELDTAETNTHAIKIYQHQGFRLVGYKANPGGDHYSVILVKWFGKAPYSDAYCSMRYRLKKFIVRMKYKPDKTKRFGGNAVRPGGERSRRINKAVEQCMAAEPGLSGADLKRDITDEYLKNGVEPYEFFRYEFWKKDEGKRREYFLDRERKKYFTQEWNVFPRNKYERYELFRPLFKREVLQIRFVEGDEELYREFTGRHKEYIMKPAKGVKGKGICKLSSDEVKDLGALKEIAGGECILEELIIQGDELAVFHPQSVNTLRYVTAVNDDGKAECLFALLRTGQGSSIVDNVGSGGIIALIDTASGRVVSDGMCGQQRFEKHPDSGVRFAGYQIPDWEAAGAAAKEAHLGLPGQKLIGWDFARTKDGWDVVEANPSPSFESVQVLSQKGLKPVLKEAFRGISQ